jgi:hypothetical protein
LMHRPENSGWTLLGRPRIDDPLERLQRKPGGPGQSCSELL